MTAPVVTANNVMQFVMPDKYKELSQLPTPLDSRVTLKQVRTVTHGTHAHMHNTCTHSGPHSLGRVCSALVHVPLSISLCGVCDLVLMGGSVSLSPTCA